MHPIEWYNHVSMRAAILGCPHKGIHLVSIFQTYTEKLLLGNCSPGYFRVNNEAQCSTSYPKRREMDLITLFFNLVENMAYKKQTWTNARNRKYRKHKKGSGFWSNRGESQDDLSLAVDGLEESSRCTMIDNYFVEKPLWVVDLGRKRNIAGVILKSSYRNQYDLKLNSSLVTSQSYLTNVDRYNIYIDHHPRRHRLQSSNLCSSLSRIDQLLFASTRLHFQCRRPMHGRYVYLEAVGGNHRWNKLFTAVLCEVFVYGQ